MLYDGFLLLFDFLPFRLRNLILLLANQCILNVWPSQYVYNTIHISLSLSLWPNVWPFKLFILPKQSYPPHLVLIVPITNMWPLQLVYLREPFYPHLVHIVRTTNLWPFRYVQHSEQSCPHLVFIVSNNPCSK